MAMFVFDLTELQIELEEKERKRRSKKMACGGATLMARVKNARNGREETHRIDTPQETKFN